MSLGTLHCTGAGAALSIVQGPQVVRAETETIGRRVT